MRALVAMLLLLLVAPSVGAVATTERPSDGACDSTGRILCAGLDWGASVSCATRASGVAACSGTWGFLAGAWSPLGLPGSEASTFTATLRICSSVLGCVDSQLLHAQRACAWTTPDGCTENLPGIPVSVTQQLALGECLTVSVIMDGHIDATAGAGPLTLGQLSYQNAGNGAGESCFVDNGR